MTKVPNEDILENLPKKHLYYTKELKPLMALYLQDADQ